MLKSFLIHVYLRITSYKNIAYMRLKNIEINFVDTNIIKGRLFIKNRGMCTIEDNIKINSTYNVNPIGGMTFSSFVTEKGALLHIKGGTRISNSAIYCKEKIVIGHNVFIGGDTRIMDSDFHSLQIKERIKRIDMDVKTIPIFIEDGVFIGASVMILKGVVIGKNSVVGAGSVVTKNIPENEIWAGNPAKFIRAL